MQSFVIGKNCPSEQQNYQKPLRQGPTDPVTSSRRHRDLWSVLTEEGMSVPEAPGVKSPVRNTLPASERGRGEGLERAIGCDVASRSPRNGRWEGPPEGRQGDQMSWGGDARAAGSGNRCRPQAESWDVAADPTGLAGRPQLVQWVAAERASRRDAGQAVGLEELCSAPHSSLPPPSPPHQPPDHTRLLSAVAGYPRDGRQRLPAPGHCCPVPSIKASHSAQIRQAVTQPKGRPYLTHNTYCPCLHCGNISCIKYIMQFYKLRRGIYFKITFVE